MVGGEREAGGLRNCPEIAVEKDFTILVIPTLRP